MVTGPTGLSMVNRQSIDKCLCIQAAGLTISCGDQMAGYIAVKAAKLGPVRTRSGIFHKALFSGVSGK